MTALLLTPVVLSLLVLAAHFFRHGHVALVLLTFVLMGLLAVRRAWAGRVVQGALVLGAAEWGRTLYTLAEARAVMGQPATRMVIILGAVAFFTLLSALSFQSGPLKRRYGRPEPGLTTPDEGSEPRVRPGSIRASGK